MSIPPSNFNAIHSVQILPKHKTEAVNQKASKTKFEPAGDTIAEPINSFNPADIKPMQVDYTPPDPAALEQVSYEEAVKLVSAMPEYTYFMADDITKRLITECNPHLIAFAKDTVAVEAIINEPKLLVFAENNLAGHIIRIVPQLLDAALEYLKTNKQELAYVNDFVGLKMITLPPANISIVEYLPYMSKEFSLMVCQRNPLLICYINENLLEDRDFVLTVFQAYQDKPQFYTNDDGQQERNDLLPHIWTVSNNHVKAGQLANPLLSDLEFLRECARLGDTFAPMILRKIEVNK
jgi:hypothetical protein